MAESSVLLSFGALRRIPRGYALNVRQRMSVAMPAGVERKGRRQAEPVSQLADAFSHLHRAER
jgi:hypothetical protein